MFVALISLLWLSTSFHAVLAYTGPGKELFSFVTRPDLKPPRWNVTYHNRSAIAPGYWFVAPYNFHALGINDRKWEACIYGPTIYDNDGELVWSGACQFGNRIAFDFKMDDFWDGEGVALTGLLRNADFPGDNENVGAGFFLGTNYTVKQAVKLHDNPRAMDMHEFNILAQGRRALVVTDSSRRFPGEPVFLSGKVRVQSNGFKEINTDTGEALFEWNAQGHVGLDESTYMPSNFHPSGRPTASWDPFHLNSVDKTDDGDYLISMRHCDMLLLINGRNGAIKWRAGGIRSDFLVPESFRWSRQHNARIISHSKDRTVVSFLDNATSGKTGAQEPTHEFSRTLIVQLDHPDGRPRLAKLLHHYDRPDHGLSIRRGNLQRLPNGNIWSSWTDGGYMTEFTADGEPLMEMRWFKRAYGNYRGYKFDGWVGNPPTKPRVAALVNSVDGVALSTLYASWNGATEVATWEFFEKSTTEDPDPLICRTNRTGFETACVVQGEAHRVRAAALDREGNVLESSRWKRSRHPPGWQPEAASPVGCDLRQALTAGISDIDSTSPFATAVILLTMILLALLVYKLVRRNFTRRWMRSSSRGSYSALHEDDVAGG